MSVRDQNGGLQLRSMQEVGISPHNIFINKTKWENFNREQYQLLKRTIRKRDILYILSLDRFDRNKEEILQEWNAITKEIETDIVSWVCRCSIQLSK
ncbi:DNA invertase Pin-like site-specific DNA recombinase [Priestia aryabhattai]|uniref:hypothetical protein n=1 Tax=Priestia aryabhattai TaxID=412384 RepID=UPI0029591661|nr:DNA invertase Pin-like site-specific DNA recombinase [Priestia aryabhattai]